ncbi:autorepressor SdpR family transcription factor [Lacticaseibacillus pabuli]|uniref:Autorepressor SdpR family transcription factor n=1 Tax=Lacticaseibacillus pabuli TaxID=3025672 RepID=A0ABY7WT01_9LACO|nr:autorepressor SdpR family transcription factor [Lacticaseibacillus sp. KACC 23028]WDF82871.1 autorepressor SdpR family transcription factor [Lacticaseibacillus sp. KACC 23028]
MAMSDTLKAISDPVRRQILELLRQGSQPAGEIAAHFDLKQATVSYHLKLLKQAGLITERKDKNFIYYDLNASVFEEVLTWIYSLGLGGQDDDQK